MRRGDHLPLLNEQGPLLDVLARTAVILIRLGRKGNMDRIPVLAHILLPHNAVAARGNCTTRHNADTFARTDGSGKEITRTLLADDMQAHGMLRRGSARARRRKGIAVQRRTVKRWIVKARTHLLSRRASHGIKQRNALRLPNRRRMSEQQINRLLEFYVLHMIPHFPNGQTG